MKLKDKKVLFLGDSITEGVGTTMVNGTHEGYRFPDLFAKNTGAIAYNYGISGTRIARQKEPSENPKWDKYFGQRVDEMNREADIVVVFGGTNDFGHGDAPLGNFDSRDEFTFYGALHTLIQKIICKYPQSVLVFLTPLHRITENNELNSFNKRVAAPLKKYVEVIKEVCEYYSVPVLDLYSVSGLQPAIECIKDIYMPDGLHPSDAGAMRIAQRLEAFLTSL